MTVLVKGPANTAWLVLMAATLLSWWLGDGHAARTPAGVGVIAVAFLKVNIVGQYFMELRAAPPPLRLVFCAWTVVVGTGLIAIYLSTN